jgi:serine/threonine-protein kinase RsbW
LDASVAVAFKAAVSREIFATNDRVTLRFIDAGEVFPAERLALARGDERFDVDPLAESGRGLRLILRAVDYFNVETRAGENVTTLIKALPDAALRHSTDDRVR